MENIDCGPNAACVNNEGSYGCVCEIGFRASNGKETFLDGKGVTCQGEKVRGMAILSRIFKVVLEAHSSKPVLQICGN